jgi:hypothetical protein
MDTIPTWSVLELLANDSEDAGSIISQKAIGHSIAHPAITKEDGAFVENKSFKLYVGGGGGWNLLDSVGPNKFFWELHVCAVVGRHRWRPRKMRKSGGLSIVQCDFGFWFGCKNKMN